MQSVQKASALVRTAITMQSANVSKSCHNSSEETSLVTWFMRDILGVVLPSSDPWRLRVGARLFTFVPVPLRELFTDFTYDYVGPWENQGNTEPPLVPVSL